MINIIDYLLEYNSVAESKELNLIMRILSNSNVKQKVEYEKSD